MDYNDKPPHSNCIEDFWSKTVFLKLDGVAPLVANPPRCNSTWHNQPICDSPSYIGVTFELILCYIMKYVNFHAEIYKR